MPSIRSIFIGGVRHRCCRLRLRMHAEVEGDDGAFRSAGRHPTFILEHEHGSLPSGWIRFRCKADWHTGRFRLMLRVDTEDVWRHSILFNIALDEAQGKGCLLQLPNEIKRLYLCADPVRGRFRLSGLEIRAQSKLRVAWDVLRRLVHESPSVPRLLAQLWATLRSRGFGGLRQKLYTAAYTQSDYRTWVKLYDAMTPDDLSAMSARVAGFKSTPTIVLAMVVGQAAQVAVKQTLDSLLAQAYPYWQLFIATNGKLDRELQKVVDAYLPRDDRFVMAGDLTDSVSTHHSGNPKLDSDAFAGLIDPGDTLPPHAFFLIAEALNNEPYTDIIYSDEDEIDTHGNRRAPRFKTDWNPELMLALNAVGRLAVVRGSLLRACGGFPFPASVKQDGEHLCLLQVSGATDARRIRHIPHILYHRRAAWEPRADGARDSSAGLAASCRAVAAHLHRHELTASVTPCIATVSCRVTFSLPTPAPRVSVIVPTRDALKLLRSCLSSVLEKTTYPNFEVIVVNNRSRSKRTLQYLTSVSDGSLVRVLNYDRPYNFSAINNFAVSQAEGTVLVFLNNDVTVISPDWIEEMARHALRRDIGPVGAKLYYPDNSVQHGGILLGQNGLADHAHKELPRGDIGYMGLAAVVQNCSAVTAACMMIRREVFEAVDGFDATSFGIAYNDADLCLRLWARGYRTIWTPHAELYHHESASLGLPRTASRQAEFIQESRRFARRWHKRILRDPYHNPNFSRFGGGFDLAMPPRNLRPWGPDTDQDNPDI